MSGDAAARDDRLAAAGHRPAGGRAARGAICVYKFGGSLLSLPDLEHRVRTLIAECPGCRPLPIVGGGDMVDVVREWDRLHALGDEGAHRLALAAMTVTAQLLRRLLGIAVVVDDLDGAAAAWKREWIPIANAETWLAGLERSEMRRVPYSWSVTSDSIAALIAGEIGARRLVLAKSTAKPQSVADAAREGQVDAAFADFAARLPRIDWVNLRERPLVIEPWIVRGKQAGAPS